MKTITLDPSKTKTQKHCAPKINWNICAWVYAILLVALTRMWSFSHPLNGDGELFAYVGRAWDRGVFPYRGIWDNKPPAIFALDAFAAHFHRQLIAIAIFDFIAFLTSIIFINLILSELECGALSKSIATFIAASIFVIPFYSATGNLTEIYILPFASLCIYSFLRATRSTSISSTWLLLAGVSAGIAGAFKPPGIAGLLAITAFLLLGIRNRIFFTLKNIAIVWIGSVIVWGGIAFYFAIHHAFHSMLNASLLYNLHYGIAPQQKHSILMLPIFIADRLSYVECIWGCVAVWFLFWARMLFDKEESHDYFSSAQREKAPLLFLWMAADTCGAVAGGRYYPHYFLPLLLSMTVVSAISIDVFIKQFASIRSFKIYLLALLIPVGVTAFHGQMDYYHGLINKDLDMKVVSFIKNDKRPGDSLFTWLYGPEIYRLTDTYAPTQWESSQYIYDFPGAYKSIGSELIAELYATQPRFITYDCDQATPKIDSVRNSFLLLLKERYDIAYRSGGTCVMVRTPVSSPYSASQALPDAGTQPRGLRTRSPQK